MLINMINTNIDKNEKNELDRIKDRIINTDLGRIKVNDIIEHNKQIKEYNENNKELINKGIIQRLNETNNIHQIKDIINKNEEIAKNNSLKFENYIKTEENKQKTKNTKEFIDYNINKSYIDNWNKGLDKLNENKLKEIINNIHPDIKKLIKAYENQFNKGKPLSDIEKINAANHYVEQAQNNPEAIANRLNDIKLSKMEITSPDYKKREFNIQEYSFNSKKDVVEKAFDSATKRMMDAWKKTIKKYKETGKIDPIDIGNVVRLGMTSSKNTPINLIGESGEKIALTLKKEESKYLFDMIKSSKEDIKKARDNAIKLGYKIHTNEFIENKVKNLTTEKLIKLAMWEANPLNKELYNEIIRKRLQNEYNNDIHAIENAYKYLNENELEQIKAEKYGKWKAIGNLYVNLVGMKYVPIATSTANVAESKDYAELKKNLAIAAAFGLAGAALKNTKGLIGVTLSKKPIIGNITMGAIAAGEEAAKHGMTALFLYDNIKAQKIYEKYGKEAGDEYIRAANARYGAMIFGSGAAKKIYEKTYGSLTYDPRKLIQPSITAEERIRVKNRNLNERRGDVNRVSKDYKGDQTIVADSGKPRKGKAAGEFGEPGFEDKTKFAFASTTTQNKARKEGWGADPVAEAFKNTNKKSGIYKIIDQILRPSITRITSYRNVRNVIFNKKTQWIKDELKKWNGKNPLNPKIERAYTKLAQEQADKFGEPVKIITPKTTKAWKEAEGEEGIIFPKKWLKSIKNSYGEITTVDYPKEFKPKWVGFDKQSTPIYEVNFKPSYNKGTIKAPSNYLGLNLKSEKIGINQIADWANTKIRQTYAKILMQRQPGGYESSKHYLKHANKVYEKLIKQGMDPKIAWYTAHLHDISKVIANESNPKHAEGIAKALKKGLININILKGSRLNPYKGQSLNKKEINLIANNISTHTVIEPFRMAFINANTKPESIIKGLLATKQQKMLANADRLDMSRFGKVKEEHLFKSLLNKNGLLDKNKIDKLIKEKKLNSKDLKKIIELEKQKQKYYSNEYQQIKYDDKGYYPINENEYYNTYYPSNKKYNTYEYNPYDYKQLDYKQYDYTPYEYTPYEYKPYEYTPYEYKPYEYKPYDYTPYDYTPYEYINYLPYNYSKTKKPPVITNFMNPKNINKESGLYTIRTGTGAYKRVLPVSFSKKQEAIAYLALMLDKYKEYTGDIVYSPDTKYPTLKKKPYYNKVDMNRKFIINSNKLTEKKRYRSDSKKERSNQNSNFNILEFLKKLKNSY